MSRLPVFLFVILIAGLSFVPAVPAEGAEKLKVVTTTTDLASIARCVGGDKVDILSLATGKEDSHHIAAKPSYMMSVRKADLWIRMGMELEIGYEPLVLDGSRNTKIRVGSLGHLDTSKGVLRLEVPTTKVDRSMGDIHPQGNPHYLLDPLNGRIVAKTIAARLAKLLPEHTAYFTEQLKAFQKDLDEHMFGRELVARISGSKLWAALLKNRLDEVLKSVEPCPLGGWMGAMRPFRGRKLIAYHRNWSYFVNRFSLLLPIEVEPKPGIPPSPGRITEVIQRVKAEEIKVLLMATYFSRKPGELVSSQTGINIVECAMFPGAQPDVPDYFAVFDNLVKRITEGYAQ